MRKRKSLRKIPKMNPNLLRRKRRKKKKRVKEWRKLARRVLRAEGWSRAQPRSPLGPLHCQRLASRTPKLPLRRFPKKLRLPMSLMRVKTIKKWLTLRLTKLVRKLMNKSILKARPVLQRKRLLRELHLHPKLAKSDWKLPLRKTLMKKRKVKPQRKTSKKRAKNLLLQLKREKWELARLSQKRREKNRLRCPLNLRKANGTLMLSSSIKISIRSILRIIFSKTAVLDATIETSSELQSQVTRSFLRLVLPPKIRFLKWLPIGVPTCKILPLTT